MTLPRTFMSYVIITSNLNKFADRFMLSGQISDRPYFVKGIAPTLVLILLHVL